MNHFEHWWKTPVQVILFFFGLVNAGVPFASVGHGTWIVLSSLVLGKPIGILLTTALARGVRAARTRRARAIATSWWSAWRPASGSPSRCSSRPRRSRRAPRWTRRRWARCSASSRRRWRLLLGADARSHRGPPLRPDSAPPTNKKGCPPRQRTGHAEPSWDEHYRDERDAAFLYRQLAAVETDAERRDLFERLAVVEDRHVARWEELFGEGGRPLPAYKTALRTRLLAWVAKRFGPALVLPLMLAEEGREVQAYLGLARHSTNRQTAQGRRRHRRRTRPCTRASCRR